jgi:hypothetical protein
VKAVADRLHAAKPGTIEAELVAIALEQTGTEHGALFVWDKDAGGLALVHHVVGGLTVTLPRVVNAENSGGGENESSDKGVETHVDAAPYYKRRTNVGQSNQLRSHR